VGFVTSLTAGASVTPPALDMNLSGSKQMGHPKGTAVPG
jgi:hypothetical protein